MRSVRSSRVDATGPDSEMHPTRARPKGAKRHRKEKFDFGFVGEEDARRWVGPHMGYRTDNCVATDWIAEASTEADNTLLCIFSTARHCNLLCAVVLSEMLIEGLATCDVNIFRRASCLILFISDVTDPQPLTRPNRQAQYTVAGLTHVHLQKINITQRK